MKEFDFGFGQVKVKIDDESLSFKQTGIGWSHYPIEEVENVLHEATALYHEMIIKGKGVILKKLLLPKRQKSIDVIQDIGKYLKTIKQ